MKNTLKIIIAGLLVGFTMQFALASYVTSYSTLEVTGDVGGTLQQIYADMYQRGNTNDTIINTVNVWEQVGNFSSGTLKNATFGSNKITNNVAGVFLVNYSASAGAGGAGTGSYEFSLNVGGVIQDNCFSKVTYLAEDGIKNMAGSCIVTTNSPASFALNVRNKNNTNNILIREADVNFSKL